MRILRSLSLLHRPKLVPEQRSFSFYILYFLHTVILAIGFGSIGWLLSAVQASAFIWLSCSGLIVYLVTVQQGGIVLAHGWVTTLIAISAITRPWPAPWAAHIPYHQPQLWAIALLLMWGIAIALIHLLALSPKLTRVLWHKLATQQRSIVLFNNLARQFPLRASINRLMIRRSRSSRTFIDSVIISWVGCAIALGTVIYHVGGTR